MNEFKTNDTFNVVDIIKKMVDHIRSPTEEGVEFFKDTINDIEYRLDKFKIVKPRQPKTSEINEEKRPRGRPRVPYRAILENGKYDTRTKDPEYQKRYYVERLQGVKIPCPNCGVHMFKVTMARHMKSVKCRCCITENITDTD